MSGLMTTEQIELFRTGPVPFKEGSSGYKLFQVLCDQARILAEMEKAAKELDAIGVELLGAIPDIQKIFNLLLAEARKRLEKQQ